MTPEQQARGEIDSQLNACGLVVQDVQHANIHAARGVPIKEFPLQSSRLCNEDFAARNRASRPDNKCPTTTTSRT